MKPQLRAVFAFWVSITLLALLTLMGGMPANAQVTATSLTRATLGSELGSVADGGVTTTEDKHLNGLNVSLFQSPTEWDLLGFAGVGARRVMGGRWTRRPF